MIEITAVLTAITNPALALLAGWAAECARAAIVRTIMRRFSWKPCRAPAGYPGC
jgi:hypothetical protein